MPNRHTWLRNARSTGSIRDFKYMVRNFQNRATIVAEGDSWFDYPGKYLVAGRGGNIIDHIGKWAHRRINLLRLESRG